MSGIRARMARAFSVGIVSATVFGSVTLLDTDSAIASPRNVAEHITTENESTMPLDQQLENCATQARATNSEERYSCATAEKASTYKTNGSAKELAETSLLSIEAWRADRAEVSPQSIAPECDLGFIAPNRFTSCSGTGWTVSNWQTVNGVRTLVGQLKFDIWSSVEYVEPENGAVPGWDLDIQVNVTYTWGNMAGGAPASIWTGCYNQSVCNTGAGDADPGSFYLAPDSSTDKWYSQYSDTMDVNETIWLQGNLGVAVGVQTPYGNVNAIDHSQNTLGGRCDNYSNRYGAACVEPRGLAFVLYDVRDNPLVDAVAKHVFDAIRTLPSHWGSAYGTPLTRLVNEDAIDANRAIACAGVTSPPNYQCDEYPLASSYEGGNGAAPNDRSTRIVPESANQSQGGITGAYYDYYRILDRDPFYVQAILADGSSAW